MKLTSDAGTKRDPDTSAVQEALRSLSSDDGFVILARTPEEYVQVSGNKLEYRANDQHWRATGTSIERALVEKVFVSYLHGEDVKRHCEWTEVTEELARHRPRGQASTGLMLFILFDMIVAIIIAVWYFYPR